MGQASKKRNEVIIMALVVTDLDSVLTIRYQAGTTAGGGPIIRQKSLNGIKPASTNQDIYDVGAALAGLVDYTLIDLRRNNVLELTNE